MKKISRVLILLVVVTLVVSLGIGCKTSTAKTTEAAETTAVETTSEVQTTATAETTENKPFEGVTLNVVNMLDWAITKPIWTRLNEFEEKTGIKVKLNEMPYDEMLEKSMLDINSHTGTIDIFMINESSLPLYKSGVVSLEDFIKNEGTNVDEWVNNLNAPKSGLYGEGDKVSFNPIFGTMTQSGYYRKDLFEDPAEKEAFKKQYGYELAAPTNMDQLLDISRFFTRDTNNDGTTDLWGLLMPGKGGHGASIFEQEIWTSNVATYFDKDGKCIFNSEHPENRDLLAKIAQYHVDLIYKYKVMPTDVVGMEFAELSELWLAGKAAMVLSWVHDIWGTVKSQETIDKIGESISFVYPRWVEGAPTWGGIWFWGINKDSKNQEAAWEFLKWISSDEIQRWTAENTPSIFVPISKENAKWAVENKLMPSALYEDPNVVLMDFTPELTIARNVVTQYWGQCLSQQITPEQYINTCAKEIDDQVAAEKK